MSEKDIGTSSAATSGPIMTGDQRLSFDASNIDRELVRLGGPVWGCISDGDPRWQEFTRKMWKRSYLVALNSMRVLEARVKALRRQQWDSPMTFFYPKPTQSQRLPDR